MNTSLILAILVACTFSPTFAADDAKKGPKTEKITINDARDKRQLSNFNDEQQPTIQRRITSYSPFGDSSLGYVNQYNGGGQDYSIAGSAYPNVQNYGPTYSVQSSGYAGGQYQQPQYIEAPEPIIEIIIKESNETLPTPEPLKLQSPKKKKEQVQVFYVKYNKDSKKGLIIDDPIPALTPAHFNPEESEDEIEEINAVPYPPSTASPPVRSTTLRTIIKPDSEVYHSNSGIHVTFNTESKHQSGHEFQEHFEESALQPIISEVHSPSVEHAPASFPHPPPPPNHPLNGNDRGRAFDIPYNGNGPNPNTPPHPLPPQNFHRFGPPPHLSGPPFLRPTPDQGLLLSYTQNQANRVYQTQNFDNRYKNPPPQGVAPNGPRFPPSEAHLLNFAPPLNTPPIKFRPQPPPPHHQSQSNHHQPKPIPIPLHHSEKVSQPSHGPSQPPHINHHQHYTNYNQIRIKPQTYSPHQSPQFQQSFPQPIRVSNQPTVSHEHGNHRLTPSSAPQLQPVAHPIPPNHNHHHNHNHNPSPSFSQPLQESISNKVQFPQKTTHLAPTPSNSIINQPLFSGNTQEFNRLVSGAELVESLPKFEQHITETVPLSEINKPFSPFRQLTSVHSAGVHIDTPVSRPTQDAILSAEHQKHIQDEQLLQQSIEHAKSYHQQQQQHQQQQAQQKPLYHQEAANPNSLGAQIIFPVNYPTKNYQLQDHQTFNLNAIPTQPSRAPSVFHEKVIPGKGVSNLATDVFAELGQSHQRHSDKVNARPTFIVGSTERNFVTNYVTSPTRKPTTFTPTTTTTTTTTTMKPPSKKVTANLPDEVPDDLRQQLLSSGILENADISVLDYDKASNIHDLESLPPEHLANFYGSGGASQISSSNRVLNVVKPNGDSVAGLQYSDDDKSQEKKPKTLPKKHNVDLKVVRFDSTNQKSIADKYIKQDSTVLPSVDIQDTYNRYLPLKVNGEQFPIPDVETLRNKKISSVVVLAPVDGLGSGDNDDEDVIEDGRYERDVIDSKEVKFLAGDSLKNLLRKPTKENFKRWLDKEAKTNVDMQSVVLLVVKNETNGQEIYMYDIGTKIVSRLKGELSTAFVNVAESNANAQDDDMINNNVTLTDSGIYEKMPAMDSEKEKITIIQAQSSGIHHNRPIFRRDNSADTKSINADQTKISISSGYSVIKR